MQVIDAFHTWLFLALNAGRSSPDWLIELARWCSTVLPVVFLVAIALALMALPSRHRMALVQVVAAMALAWLAARALQAFWPQPRPFVRGLGIAWLPHAASPSFPSMHATVAAAAAVALRGLGMRPVTWLALAAAGLIAWSRICLGLHFPVDVVAGFGLGTAAALLTLRCFRPMPRGVRLRLLRRHRRLRRAWRGIFV